MTLFIDDAVRTALNISAWGGPTLPTYGTQKSAGREWVTAG
ncbi:hypothetical protein [Mycolicibacterium moriokaense]|nr:hypothetical protein [Mycolicibacterium moriokaense]